MTALFFVDSWGGTWVTCDASHPRAEAFGPRGVSRPTSPEEAAGLVAMRPRLVDGEEPAHLWPRILVPADEIGEWADEYEAAPA